MPRAKPSRKISTNTRSKNSDTARFEGVEFWIISDTSADHLTGVVLVRPGEMVLEIHQGRDGLYHLPGTLAGQVYNAREKGAPDRSDPVRARWTRLGAYYIGIWVESGYEALFRFKLPET
jgi:hypothetical protein